jgi:subtilisin family serine protease
MVCEYTFYENAPTQIDLQLGANARKTVGGGFTTEELQGWGFVADARIPKRVDALDSDIELAIDEGIIYVGAAGNGSWKHDIPGGLDWNNTFEMAGRYPDSVANPYYYMRGTSPTANDNTTHPDGNFDIPNICVGSIDVTTGDYKATYSDCGPGVDIFAPGTNIISTYPSGVSDSRGSGFLGKLSGTSMASPQVCGVLACALEQNPHWKQEQAKAYITGIAKQGQITDTTGGPADLRDLQGAPDKYLFYRKERPDTGTTVPKQAVGPRPTSGATWPRPRIYRFR